MPTFSVITKGVMGAGHLMHRCQRSLFQKDSPYLEGQSLRISEGLSLSFFCGASPSKVLRISFVVPPTRLH